PACLYIWYARSRVSRHADTSSSHQSAQLIPSSAAGAAARASVSWKRARASSHRPADSAAQPAAMEPSAGRNSDTLQTVTAAGQGARKAIRASTRPGRAGPRRSAERNHQDLVVAPPLAPAAVPVARYAPQGAV